MSDAVLAHPLVRGYLRALDQACARLPYDQARELHEQIAGHLEEALPPGTGDSVVQAELSRLGHPAALATEAAGPVPPSAGRRLRNRLARVRWWIWALTALLIAAIGTGVWFVVAMNTVAPLTSMSSEWLYSADQAHAVESSADAVTQTTIPVRFGQRQGMKLLLVNDSDWTQTITGLGDGFRPFSSSPWQAAVQSGRDINPLGVALHGGDSYVPWGSIPPHSTRWVYVSWISDTCIGRASATIIDFIPLKVRVGLTHKTENIALDQYAFALVNKTKSDCPAP